MLNSFVVYEKVNKNRVKNLIASSIDIVPIDDKRKLEQYLKLHDNNGFRITYQHPELKDIGRVKQIPFTGLGTFSQKIRGYLADELYVDVDMINCHPVVLQHIFTENRLNCLPLNNYINNRDKFLKDNKVSKEDFLTMINREELKINSEEIKIIHSTIYDQLLPILLSKNLNIIPKRDWNKKGQIISGYLQYREFNLLLSIYEYCKSEKMIVDVIMHDGFFIRIEGDINHEYIERYLVKFNETIKKTSGIDMKFKIKPHDISLKYIVEKKDIGSNYSVIKSDFEKTCCKILGDGTYVSWNDTEFQLITKNTLENKFMHLDFTDIDNRGNFKTENFIKKWTHDPNIRIYEKIGCFPNNLLCPPKVFNIWRPFAMELIVEYTPKFNEIKKLLDHIFIICGKEERVYNYFIKWIGHSLKYPHIKIGNAPIFWSKQGAGKTLVVSMLRGIMGFSKVIESSDPSRDIWGNFNHLMAESFLVNLNELQRSDTGESMGKIKALITDETITINKKFCPSYQIQSFHRFIITTNNPGAMPTCDDERRFVFIQSDNCMRGNREYFNELFDLLKDVNVMKTLFEYFKGLDGLDKFHSELIPETSYHSILKEESKLIEYKWLDNFMQSKQEMDFFISTNNMYIDFKNFLSENKYREINYGSFSKGIRLLGVDGMSRHHGKERGWKFDLIKVKNWLNNN